MADRGRAAGVAPPAAVRVLDIVLSTAALVVLGPLLALLWLLVLSTSRGPGLFRQVRVGQGGAPFTMPKLRTMRCGPAGPEITTADDPRVTRLGQVLRAANLDELPQLVCVLRGSMTLVGPRPETVALAARYPESCRWVLQHRPGLTGPAQVRLRDRDVVGTTMTEQTYLSELVPRRVACDAAYLRRPTVRAALRVLVETAQHVAGHQVRTAPDGWPHVPAPRDAPRQTVVRR